jgi:hypothetical protein
VRPPILVQGCTAPQSGPASNRLNCRHSTLQPVPDPRRSLTGSFEALRPARQRGDLRSCAPLLGAQVLGSREFDSAPKLIAHTHLAVPMIGMSLTHSPSSGTGISSCPCPHQLVNRATRYSGQPIRRRVS